ncbi:neutral/alkaline non-lysosomal ceramidase N-terminal domain-containing protein [Lonepinella koalarum]|uniref:neutral/alkaline non-lysosomal ceramidase N-terminal domain-containing protein n=1 Tax=Lonepinella koalarum TaxID=53417 RepID=UPI003F6E063F
MKMKQQIIRWVATFFAALGLVTTSSASPETLQVGSVKVDITPKDLTNLNSMGGSFKQVSDPIFMRTLVIKNQHTKLAITTLDVIEVGDMMPVRQRIADELGFKVENVLIAPTHTHSSPRIGNVSAGASAHDGSAESKAFTEVVYNQMIQAIKQAESLSVDATMGMAQGQLDININRDEATDKGYKIGRNPAGISDKTLQVVQFNTLQGKPIAILYNYAIHPILTLGMGDLSSDLTGVASVYIEQQLGDNAVALFTQGAVADQNPRAWARNRADDDEQTKLKNVTNMREVGKTLAEQTLATLKTITPQVGDARLSGQEKVITCPVQQTENKLATMTQADVSTVGIRLIMFKINNFTLAGVSGEVDTPLLHKLQQQLSNPQLMLVSMANDRVGYLPEDAAYDLGTFAAKGSPVVKGCFESKMLQEFKMMNESK